ncbi:MAG TPA: PadR family transcriptional regulator [Kofleriaceae bacterium]
MSSQTRLLVLGVVRIFQPVHGYEVRRELITWHAEEWANVAPGSIYSSLKTLTKEGLIEVVGTDKGGARPDRTMYQLTPSGEHRMNELLRDTLWQVNTLVDPLVAAISLMSFLDRGELVSALEGRAAKIAGMVDHAARALELIDDVETPAHVRPMMELINARLSSELAWSEKFRAELKKGMYRAKGDAGWAPVGVEHGLPTSPPPTHRPGGKAARSGSGKSPAKPVTPREMKPPRDQMYPGSKDARADRPPMTSDTRLSPKKKTRKSAR